MSTYSNPSPIHFSSNLFKVSISKKTEESSFLFSCSHRIQIGDYIVKFSSNKPIIMKDSEISLFLVGNIFENDNYLLKMYSHGINYLTSKLNGHYLLVIIDSSLKKLFIITDRTNSYKCFLYNHGNSIFLANDIALLDSIPKQPDPTSLYQYLTNGFVLQNRTLLKDVSTIPYASYFCFDQSGVKVEKYWQLRFGSIKISFQEALENLYSLIEKSIVRSADSFEHIFISTSGGYDISTVLGLLAKNIDVSKLNAFSYYYKTVGEHTDCDVARLQAQLLGIEFFQDNLFPGDFDNFIDGNALWGQGISNICEEFGFWEKFRIQTQDIATNSAIFFGEEFFGVRSFNCMTNANIMNALKISRVPIKENEVLFRIWEQLGFSIEDTEQELNSIDGYLQDSIRLFNNATDSLNYLYYDTRLTNIMTSWRANFPGRFMNIVNPLLDNNIIDFVVSLPATYRQNKSLFRKMSIKKLPELYQIRRAFRSNTIDDWPQILHRNRYLIHDHLQKYNMQIRYDELTEKTSQFMRFMLRIPGITIRNKHIKKVDLIKRLLIAERFYGKI